MAKKKSHPTNIGWAYAGGIIFILLVLIAVIFTARQPAEPVLPTVQDIEEIITTTQLGENFDVTTQDTFAEAERIQRILNESQGKDVNQETIYGSLVQDPDKPELYYFATYELTLADIGNDIGSPLNDQNEVFQGIYQYNTDTFNWERLYKQSATVGEEPQLYQVMAYDKGQLVLLGKGFNWIAGVCEQDWLLERFEHPTEGLQTTGLVQMDLANPYGAWRAYEAPDTIRAAAEEQKAACEAEL